MPVENKTDARETGSVSGRWAHLTRSVRWALLFMCVHVNDDASVAATVPGTWWGCDKYSFNKHLSV